MTQSYGSRIGTAGLPGGLQMCTILHVEDNPAHAMLVKRSLEKMPDPCRLRQVQDGQAALDYLSSLKKGSKPEDSFLPAMVLLDINLPRISGFEVLKKIKQDDEFSNIPVIMLTSSSAQEDRERAYQSLADDYLLKPLNFSDFCGLLEDTIRRWITRRDH